MIYVHITISVMPGKLIEFHDVWSTQSLPVWERLGGKHIGSFNTSIGDGHEIVRLFAFDDYAHYERFQQFLARDEAGRKLTAKLYEYIAASKIKVLSPVSYSPLQ